MKPFAAFIFLLASVTTCHHATAQQSTAYSNQRAIAATQWEVLDLKFESKSQSTTPLKEQSLTATFKHSSGTEQTVVGFYDGDGQRVLRFTPPKPGEWKFRTVSNITDLNNLTGTVIASTAAHGRRGGIVVGGKQKTRFRYQNGENYFPIAMECDWLFALDAENADDIPRTRKLVDTLAENGFNQVVMNVFAFDVNWPKDDRLIAQHEFGSPESFPFGGSNAAPDHSRLNYSYFQRLDRVINYLDKKGMVAHLMVYVWNKNVNWPAANSPEDNEYFDYVVKRYQAYPNLVWDISKEALGYGHDDVDYITSRIQRLRKLDQYSRLVTVHDYGYCRRFTKQVDFVSVQLWSSELYGVMRRVVSDFPGKPILNIEHGGYERGPYVVFTGNYTSPEVCLERAWQCVFAGTYPTHYWQGAAWNAIISDINSLPPEDRPRLQYYRHMNRFVERYGLDELKAGDKKSNAGFCLHNGKDRFIYYVPKECEFIGVRLPRDKRGANMRGTWFNPRTGVESEPILKPVTQWPAFDVPDDSGFHLLIVEIQNNETTSPN